MAVTAYWYANALGNNFGGTAGGATPVDFESNTIKVALTTSDYTPNQDTHDFFNDVTNEVTATGYTAGGATLASKALTVTANVVAMDAADVTWATSTITARRAVVYKSTGTASDDALLCWIDFGADVSSSSGDFTISWDAAGIMTITAADAP